MMEMVRRFLRQKFSNAGVVIALSALALLAAPQIAASGGASGFEMSGTLAVLILAAGCVARDASGGALQMILCRPIRRGEYLLGRYLGILAAFAAFLLAASLLGVAFARGVIPLLGGGARPVDFGALGTLIAATLLSGIATAATILMLSTFLPGYGDVLGFILLTPLFALPDVAAQILRAPAVQKAGQAVRENLLPSLDWTAVLQGRNPLAEPTGRWVLAVVLYLIAALVLFSRREFAYGQD
jgi:ABC-type transport system involved in multi-copper enzyme maturation permease subunit